MAEKRRDHKGRVLKEGESQRANKTYMYRFTDASKKRHTLYAPTLSELREKEDKLQFDLARGLVYDEKKKTLAEFLDMLMSHKRNLKPNTKRTYEWHIKELKKWSFVHLKIKDIRTSAAKNFVLELEESGFGFSTIKAMHGLMKSACEIAVEDDVIFRNPFYFSLTQLLSVRMGHRVALTKEQQAQVIDFVSSSDRFLRLRDSIIILLGTGLRVGELCGLTEGDIDFTNRRIIVRHQLCSFSLSHQTLTSLKSDASERIIPMSDDVQMALMRTIKENKRITNRQEICGHTDFVFVSEEGFPRRTLYFSKAYSSMEKEFNKQAPEPIVITPHVLRHTFCTNMLNAGMDVKSLQYLMGHASADMTLNTYAHTTFPDAENAFRKVVGGR